MAEIERSAARAPLSGWRSIAGYLDCDQSTVKRWAASRNLPVYRPAGSEARKGVPVFAYAEELDQWLKGQSVAARPSSPAQPEAEVEAEATPTIPAAQTGASTGPRMAWMRSAAAVAALCVVLIAGGGVLLASTQPARNISSVDPLAGVPAETRQLYLDAYYLWQKRTPASLSEAQAILARVLEQAPRFALAEADLATVYNLMVEYDVMNAEVGYSLSRQAAERAIEIDPKLAQPHSVLGDITYFWDRDYEAGLEHLRLAVELNPKDITSRHWYASALMAAGRFDEAAEHIQMARELEPLSRSIVVSEAMIRLGQGQAALARELLTRLVANEPDYRSPYRFLAFAELALKNYPGYLAALHKRFSLVGDDAADEIVSAGERAFAGAGPAKMAKAMLEATVQHAEQVKDPAMVAHFLALGGDWQGAVQWLVRTPSRRFSYYGIDPAYDGAKQDPAFRAAIATAGIPAIW